MELLKSIEEFEKYVVITGFGGMKLYDTEAFLEQVRRKKQSGVEVQFFDASFVASWKHLYFAVLDALTSFRSNRNISKNLAMEIMLYASAQHQIKKAIELLKINPKSTDIAVLIVADRPEVAKEALSTISELVNAKPNDRVLELSEEKIRRIREVFNVADSEIQAIMEEGQLEKALTDLVIERMALLATQK
jgi:tRNA threonylcarbamoyladenosine modification (KEOPS) complex Cgi121 subunit